MDFFERDNVVNIFNIEQPPCHGSIASNALCADWQLQVLGTVQARFDFRDNGAAVFIGGIQG